MNEATINEIAMSMIKDTVSNIYDYVTDKEVMIGTLGEISGILRFAIAVKEAMDDA